MVSTRSKRQAQQQSGLPPSPQVVLPETSRKRTRSKKAQKTPEAPEQDTTEYVEDPKSEIQASFSSSTAHPVPGVVPASPITPPPELAEPPASPAARPVRARLSDTAALFASALHDVSPHSAAGSVRVESLESSIAQVAPPGLLRSPLATSLAPPSTPIEHLKPPVAALSALPNTSVGLPRPSLVTPPGPLSTHVTPTQYSASPLSVATSTTSRVSPRLIRSHRIPAVPQTRLHLWVDAAPEDLTAEEPSNPPSNTLAVPPSLVPQILALIAQRRVTTSNKLTHTTDAGSNSVSASKRKLSDDTEMPPPARRRRFAHRAVKSPETTQNQRQALSESKRQPKSGPETSNTSQRRTKIVKLDKYDSKGNIQLGGTKEVLINSDESEDGGFPFSPPQKENRRGNLWNGSERINGNGNLHRERPRVPALQRSENALFDPFTSEYDSHNEQGPVSERETPVPAAQLAQATPQVRRWGLGSILNSARSVSRFIPLLNARPIAAAPQTVEDTNRDPHPITTPAQALPQSLPQTEPRQTLHSVAPGNAPATERAAPADRPQLHKPSAKVALKTKRQVLDDRKRRAERNFMREQAAFVKADDARKAQEAKEREEKRRQAEKAATPGGKRKRLPSPDTIPNPKGCSYGMDLNYFYVSSSDEEEELTPTKKPPYKKSRISETEITPGPVLGDPHRARPYTGVLFAKSTREYQGGNIFGEAESSANSTDAGLAATSPASINSARAAAARAASMGPVREGVQVTQAELSARGYLDNAPRFQMPGPPSAAISPSRTFTVPDASDSDESDGEDNESDVTTNPTTETEIRTNAPPTGVAQGSSSGEHLPSGSIVSPSNKSRGAWTQPPPPAPSPSHATLPSGSSEEDQLHGAIAKARANAMKHAPTKSSSLRQSSRLSSPRVAADNGGEKSVQIKGLASKVTKDVTGQTANAKARISAPAGKEMVCTPTTAEVAQSNSSVSRIEHGASLHIGEVRDMTAHTGDALTAYEEWRQSADPVVSKLVESAWTGQDTEMAEDGLEEELNAYLAANAPSPPDAYTTFMRTADAAIVDLIESGWTDQDDETAAASFAQECDAFIALPSVA